MPTSTLEEIPSTLEELNRKVLEAISEMANAYDEGQMSKEAFYQSLTAINLTTLGLIDTDVSDWVSTALKENVPSFIERRAFAVNGSIAILSRSMGSDEFLMIQNAQSPDTQKRTIKSFSEQDNPAKSCTHSFNLFAEQLINRGFKEVK